MLFEMLAITEPSFVYSFVSPIFVSFSFYFRFHSPFSLFSCNNSGIVNMQQSAHIIEKAKSKRTRKKYHSQSDVRKQITIENSSTT